MGKDDLTDSLEKFDDFENFARGSEQNIADYIAKFDQKYNTLKNKDMTMPPGIIAFKLLRKANITKNERLLVLTGMDYATKDELYEQAKKSLLKFKGEQGAGCDSSDISPAIKLEPAFLAQHEDALMAAGPRNQYYPRRPWRGAGGRGNFSGGVGGRGNYSRGISRSVVGRPTNPNGLDGKPIPCNSCGSFRHLIANCPDTWQNRSTRVNVVTSDNTKFSDIKEEQMVLFTGYKSDNLYQLAMDAQNCAVLDSACSSTVCGQSWIDNYIDSLDSDERGKVLRTPSEKVFKFGAGEKQKSKETVSLPAFLAGHAVQINTDVVNSDIPLLLSKDAMKRAKVKLDLVNDVAEVLGETVSLDLTSSGHYCIPINKTTSFPIESVCAVNIQELDNKEKYKTLLKIHRQFAHLSAIKMKALLVDANVWHDEFQTYMDKIYKNCDMCIIYKRTPSRSVVSLPLASKFNEKVAMDLKKWGEKWILHMVDMWSRFSVSTFITRKRPSEVIDKVLKCWIGIFGVMESILTDNGGEFNAEELSEVTSILGVRVHTIAAQSPFQNGLCERNHAITDNILVKLVEDYPSYDINVLLCWANMAKNVLQMHYGYSSYQLVFGKHANLPNVMSDSPPALEGKTQSDVLAKRLNTLHSARVEIYSV